MNKNYISQMPLQLSEAVYLMLHLASFPPILLVLAMVAATGFAHQRLCRDSFQPFCACK